MRGPDERNKDSAWKKKSKSNCAEESKQMTHVAHKLPDKETDHLGIEKNEDDENKATGKEEEVNEGIDPLSINMNNDEENKPTRDEEKSLALNDSEVLKFLPTKAEDVVPLSNQSMDTSEVVDDIQDDINGEDQHDDVCDRCFKGGTLLCCDTCTLAYHTKCVGLSKLPDGDWSCPTCVIEFSRIDPYLKVRKGNVLIDAYFFLFLFFPCFILYIRVVVNLRTFSIVYMQVSSQTLN